MQKLESNEPRPKVFGSYLKKCVVPRFSEFGCVQDFGPSLVSLQLGQS